MERRSLVVSCTRLGVTPDNAAWGFDYYMRTGTAKSNMFDNRAMKKKPKVVTARNAGELAEVLGLERADGIEFAVRSALNTKIIEVVERRGLTRVAVAALAHTSRTRVTAIMSRNTKDVSHVLSSSIQQRSASGFVVSSGFVGFFARG